MLHRHYSPRQRLRLFESAEGPGPAAPGEAIVRLRRPARGETGTHWLSESGKLTEVARALFGLLRKLDNEPRVTRIACELPAPEGLGRALRDRLERAAAR
jgi:L-threonylcarbamoyladenylate synthase